jgi:hypothetical protein
MQWRLNRDFRLMNGQVTSDFLTGLELSLLLVSYDLSCFVAFWEFLFIYQSLKFYNNGRLKGKLLQRQIFLSKKYTSMHDACKSKANTTKVCKLFYGFLLVYLYSIQFFTINT